MTRVLDELANRGQPRGVDDLIDRIELQMSSYSSNGRPAVQRRSLRSWSSSGLLIGILSFVGVLAVGFVSFVYFTRQPQVALVSGPVEAPDPGLAVAQDGGPRVRIVELGVEGQDATSISPGRTDPLVGVEATLEATGLEYDALPGFTTSAALFGSRVVVAGGNETGSAELWYSDGGAWLPASIDWSNVGGEFRLADGLQHVLATESGFLAWEPVQVVENSEPRRAGSLILVSTDGETWTSHLIEQHLGGILPWQDGFIAVTFEPSVNPQSSVVWSSDFESWSTLAELGSGEAIAFDLDGESVTVTLKVYPSQSEEDGTMTGLSVETYRGIRVEHDG